MTRRRYQELESILSGVLGLPMVPERSFQSGMEIPSFGVCYLRTEHAEPKNIQGMVSYRLTGRIDCYLMDGQSGYLNDRLSQYEIPTGLSLYQPVFINQPQANMDFHHVESMDFTFTFREIYYQDHLQEVDSTCH